MAHTPARKPARAMVAHTRSTARPGPGPRHRSARHLQTPEALAAAHP
jgi:hypothetical protein